MLAASLAAIALHGHHHAAFAKGGGDDDDDSSGDDDDGGADKSGSDSSDDDEDPQDAKDQPAVTAGGLFTIESYPVSEIRRPLTMTQGITQLRLGLGTDISAKGAFGSGGLSLDALYGVSDNFTVIGGFQNAYNMKQFSFYAGFEGALVYDLVDIRLAANVHRSAIPEFMDFTANDGTVANLPDGNFSAGGTKFSLDLGFPFRYAIKPEIAIIALQTLISIDFNAVDLDHTVQQTDMTTGAVTNVAVPNNAKPDLNPSIGIATNPIPPLSIVIFAQLRVPDFDTSAGAFQVPVTARLEFSPTQKFDVGLEFILLNVKPPDGQSPIDNRFLSLFMQARI